MFQRSMWATRFNVQQQMCTMDKTVYDTLVCFKVQVKKLMSQTMPNRGDSPDTQKYDQVSNVQLNWTTFKLVLIKDSQERKFSAIKCYCCCSPVLDCSSCRCFFSSTRFQSFGCRWQASPQGSPTPQGRKRSHDPHQLSHSTETWITCTLSMLLQILE